MSQQRSSGTNSIVSILTIVIVIVGIYYAFTVASWLLGVLAIPLFIATFFIDRNVIINYGKFLANTFKKNPIMGVLGVLLTIFLHPFLIAALFGKAMFNKKTRDAGRTAEVGTDGDYVNYEEVNKDEEEIEFELDQDFEDRMTADKKDSDILDYHNDPEDNPLDKSKPKDDYDELFEDLDFDEKNYTG